MTSPLHLFSPGWSHAVRTMIAAALALYIAYFLQLESPASAATTVLIVANPIHGMVLAKSVYRFLGTILGAAVSVMLIALFAQTPELFIFAAGIWIALCTAISSLTRRFRAYGAVLAGYTIALVAFGATDSPLSIFDLAMARVAVVTIGIVTSAVVTILLAPNVASNDFPVKLRGAITSVADVVRLALIGGDEEMFIRQRFAASGKIQALETALYGASAESAAIASRSGYIRRAGAALMGLLAAASALREPIEGAEGRSELLRPSLDRITAFFERLATDSESVRDMTKIDASLAEIEKIRLCSDSLQPAGNADQRDTMQALIAASRLEDLVEHAAVLLESLRGYKDSSAKPIDIRLPHHRDIKIAIINGLRGLVLTWLLGAFWIYTAWPDGDALFLAAVPFCCLIAASERQQADSVVFLIGTFMAMVAGFFCTYGLLAQISGFPLLVAALAPFILVTSYLTTKPAYANGAIAFLSFFVFFVGATNPMKFDLSSYLNTSFAILFGVACIVPCFRVIFPQNRWHSTVQLARELGRSLAKLAAAPRASRLLPWEYQAHDRLAVMAARLPFDNINRARLINGALAAIRMGREIVHAQILLEKSPFDGETKALVARALHAFRQATTRPQIAIDQAHKAAEYLLGQAQSMPEESARVALRTTAALQECSALLTRYEGFFTAPQGRGELAK